MRVEPETAADGGMTCGAVALCMARSARLETLSGCLAVPQAEPSKYIVVPGGANSPTGDKARLLVTALAKLRRVVTIAAIRFASIGRARVAREKILCVVPGLLPNVGAVALETCRAHVAGLARFRTRIRLGPMTFPEFTRVSRRRPSRQLRSRRTPRPGGWQRRDHTRRDSNVTGHAALPGVTRRARRSRSLRLLAMRAQESGSLVARKHRQWPCECGRPGIERECSDHRRLGGVHVTRDAQVSRVTCRAARRDAGFTRRADTHPRKPAMAAERKIRGVVRTRTGKARDVDAGQTWRVGQWHVTRRAGLARNIHVRLFQAVTIETLPDNGIAHSHPRRSGRVVTCRAIADDCAVGGIARSHSAVMHLVREPPVSRARAGSRLPCYFLLHHAIVTRLASYRLGPHRLSSLDYSGVT